MGMGKILTRGSSKTPEQISMKLGIHNYIGGMTTRVQIQTSGTTVTAWVVSANMLLVTCCSFLVYLFSFLLYFRDCAELALVDRF